MAASHGPSHVVGIDLGGTNIQAAVVDSAHVLLGRAHHRTDPGDGVEAVLDRIAACAQHAIDDAGVENSTIGAVGIAAAGAIDADTGVVLHAPNLNWRDVPLREALHERLGRPVLVENDVNGALWGEYTLGAGRDRGDALGVWIGTGIGGALVLNGRIYHGEFQTAGEIGQTILCPDRPARQRTLEELCSRTGMSNMIRRAVADQPGSVLASAAAGSPGAISTRAVAEAIDQGDALAQQIVDEAADLTGIAIANLVTVLAIDTVIVGGGVTETLGAAYLNRIRTSFDVHVFPARCRAASLRMTALAGTAGLLGAALLARERMGSAGR